MKKEKEFVQKFQNQIEELANQDKVRNALITQELDDGTLDQSMSNSVATGWAMYTYSLAVGFSEEQSFEIAMRQMFGGNGNE